MSLSGFGIKTIQEFFNKSGSYYVPNYQRDYAWEVKLEVNDLWEDIMNVYNDGIREYCLGQIVIHKFNDDGHYNLIDGQQRTATLFLLFLAFKETFKNMVLSNNYSIEQNDKLNRTANKIDGLLGIVDKDDNEDKLYLGESDKDFFRTLIYDRSAIRIRQEKRTSRKKLWNTLEFFKSMLISKISESGNTNDSYLFILDLYNCILKNIKLLYVETKDESEAFMVFETLNARGKDLETSDLLKNYFFRTGSNNLRIIQSNWNKMSDKFDGYSITSYIRCLWNSENDFCREKMLYRNIKNKCNTNSLCKNFTDELNVYSDIYLSMLDPQNHVLFESGNYKDDIQEILKTLSELGTKSYYPVILSYYIVNKNSQTIRDEIYKILVALRKLIVRDIVICKNNPNKYEVDFASLAKQISNQDIVGTDKIINSIKCLSVDDSVFESNFMAYKESNSAAGKEKIRYLLRSIIKNESHPMSIIVDNNAVHIEHIMPVKKGEWNISDDEHAENLWKIGNLTLLENNINIDVGNSTFDVKKQFYRSSNIPITNKIADLEKWDIEEINKRQETLLRIAKDIWSF